MWRTKAPGKLCFSSTPRAEPTDPVELVAGDREREVGAGQAQRAPNAAFRSRKPRHHQIERIAGPLAVGEQPVEFGVGAVRRRLQRAARALEQGAKYLPPEFSLVQRRKFDRLLRI